MKISAKLILQKERIAFLLIFLVSTLFYLFNINYSDIWIDETFSKALVEHSFRDMIGSLKNDFHPPLYFFGLKIFVTIFGSNTFTLRAFSVLGVLSTIVLGYVVGQRVFGKSGALYFCLLLLSLPMLASYSHDARMYTWGAFSVTGVFLYAALYISSNKRKDLIFLMFFSLAAAYIHYYGLIAAFWANVFVAALLFARKNSSWRIHLGYSFVAALLYLPWLFVLFHHTIKAQGGFWVPALTLQTIISCFVLPFTQKFWISLYSLPMIIIVYSITLWVIYRNYIVKKDSQGIVLGLSLFIFGFTILTTAVISLFSQPVLYHRYIMNIVTMLIVPPTLFFITIKNKWLKGVLITALLICGIVISLKASYFSYGPYKQSIEYLHKTYPELKKIFHVFEVSAGPFIEYSNPDIKNYWFKNEQTISFTNMDVFHNLYTTDSIGKVLKNDESFCLVGFENQPFNENNLKQILSQSQILKVDTIVDNKMKLDDIMIAYIHKIVLYILKYQDTVPEKP
jgi:4-amino-4-deoxy-L-arabinose transferase-like glycosyltransferase